MSEVYRNDGAPAEDAPNGLVDMFAVQLHERPARQGAPMTGQRRCVLLIEDDKDVSDAIETALEFSDVHVMSYSNGREALDWLLDRQLHEIPSLILLDLVLPVMNGWEFRHEQLRCQRLALIPTILITSAERGEADSKMMGCAYLRKPLDLDELLEAVHAVGASIRDVIKTSASCPSAKR